jgi:hypothetical protein
MRPATWTCVARPPDLRAAIHEPADRPAAHMHRRPTQPEEAHRHRGASAPIVVSHQRSRRRKGTPDAAYTQETDRYCCRPRHWMADAAMTRQGEVSALTPAAVQRWLRLDGVQASQGMTSTPCMKAVRLLLVRAPRSTPQSSSTKGKEGWMNHLHYQCRRPRRSRFHPTGPPQCSHSCRQRHPRRLHPTHPRCSLRVFFVANLSSL